MLVILDRDGVINYESADFIKSPEEWIPIPGSLEAIAELKSRGHQVVVATNQSGIARGLYSHEVLHQIHAKMLTELKKLHTSLDGIFYCPHHPEEQCSCRKPKPGLYLQIGEKFGNDLSRTLCIGDSLRDIQAAQAIGAKPILVLTGNGRKTLESSTFQGVVDVYKDLAECVKHILLSRSE